MQTATKQKFELGITVMTRGALEIFRESNGENPAKYLGMHLNMEQGELSAEDVKENELSLREGFRIFSSFRLNGGNGSKIWIITDAIGDDGKRESTCILTPEEY